MDSSYPSAFQIASKIKKRTAPKQKAPSRMNGRFSGRIALELVADTIKPQAELIVDPSPDDLQSMDTKELRDALPEEGELFEQGSTYQSRH